VPLGFRQVDSGQALAIRHRPPKPTGPLLRRGYAVPRPHRYYGLIRQSAAPRGFRLLRAYTTGLVASDLPSFPCRSFRACRPPYAGGPVRGFPVTPPVRSRLPLTYRGSPPTVPASASYTRRGLIYDAARFASCCGPLIGLAPRAGFWALCRARFWRLPSPGAGAPQARWANGFPPITGTFTRQDSTGILAAHRYFKSQLLALTRTPADMLWNLDEAVKAK